MELTSAYWHKFKNKYNNSWVVVQLLLFGGEYMPKTSYICNCNVIHEDIVNDVKSKM